MDMDAVSSVTVNPNPLILPDPNVCLMRGHILVLTNINKEGEIHE